MANYLDGAHRPNLAGPAEGAVLPLHCHRMSSWMSSRNKINPVLLRRVAWLWCARSLVLPLEDLSLYVRAVLSVDRRKSLHGQPLELMERSVIHQI